VLILAVNGYVVDLISEDLPYWLINHGLRKAAASSRSQAEVLTE
jgi:uncharacterized protein (DUF2164 family)